MVRVEVVQDSDIPDAEAARRFEQEVIKEIQEELLDDLDDFDENETLAERILALKDVVSPSLRAKVSSTVCGFTGLVQAVLSYGGKTMWLLGSTTLLIGVPLSLCIVSEQQLIEMEKSMQLDSTTNAVLAPGVESNIGSKEKV